VSANLDTAGRSEEAPSPGRAGPVLSLVAAAVFPFDGVLAGMVAAGLGIDAIRLYLSLSRAALDDGLARLGLPTPHDRPVRRPGYRGWSTADIIRLIAWRIAGIHPETIGARLGGRSAAAVRGKCRRLGIPAPPRNLLHRLDPVTLVDPTPGFGLPAFVPAAKSSEPSAICGTAAGAPRWSQPVAEPQSPDSSQPDIVTNGSVIPPPAAAHEAPTSRAAKAVAASPDVAGPTPSRLQKAIADARAAKRPLQKDPLVAFELALRFMSSQSHWAIAKELGTTPSSISSLRTRYEIPSDPDRSKLVDTYDELAGRANFERLCVIKTCIETGNVFTAPREDKNVKHCRRVRFAMGRLGDYDKYKRWLVNLMPPKPVPAKEAAVHLAVAYQVAA